MSRARQLTFWRDQPSSKNDDKKQLGASPFFSDSERKNSVEEMDDYVDVVAGNKENTAPSEKLVSRPF